MDKIKAVELMNEYYRKLDAEITESLDGVNDAEKRRKAWEKETLIVDEFVDFYKKHGGKKKTYKHEVAPAVTHTDKKEGKDGETIVKVIEDTPAIVEDRDIVGQKGTAEFYDLPEFTGKAPKEKKAIYTKILKELNRAGATYFEVRDLIEAGLGKVRQGWYKKIRDFNAAI